MMKCIYLKVWELGRLKSFSSISLQRLKTFIVWELGRLKSFSSDTNAWFGPALVWELGRLKSFSSVIFSIILFNLFES